MPDLIPSNFTSASASDSEQDQPMDQDMQGGMSPLLAASEEFETSDNCNGNGMGYDFGAGGSGGFGFGPGMEDDEGMEDGVMGNGHHNCQLPS